MKKPSKPDPGSNVVTKRKLDWDTYYEENPHIPRRPEHMKGAAKTVEAKPPPPPPDVVTPPAPPPVLEDPELPPVEQEMSPTVEEPRPAAEEPEPPPMPEEPPPVVEEPEPVVLPPVEEEPLPVEKPAAPTKAKRAARRPKPKAMRVPVKDEFAAFTTLLGQITVSRVMQKSFGLVVRGHLLLKRMSQREASDAMGFKNRGQFGNLLDARSVSWTPERLAKLREVLETTAAVLLNDLQNTPAAD